MGRPPAACTWLPAEWPADLFPLGGEPDHCGGWRSFVRSVLDGGLDTIPPDDSRYGWLTLARATRLLAHHHGLIPAERVLAPLPASRDDARREAYPLLDGLMLVRLRAPGPGNTPAGGGDDGRPPLSFDEPTWEVLVVLRGTGARLMKLVEIETATGLSKQTVGGAVADLIAWGLASRPQGERKGVALTADGVAVVDRVRKSSADHP